MADKTMLSVTVDLLRLTRGSLSQDELDQLQYDIEVMKATIKLADKNLKRNDSIPLKQIPK